MFRASTTRMLSTSVSKAPTALVSDIGKLVPVYYGDKLIPGSNGVKQVPIYDIIKQDPGPKLVKPITVLKMVKPVSISNVAKPIPVTEVAKMVAPDVVELVTEQQSFINAITRGVPDPDTFSYRAAFMASMKPTPNSLMHKSCMESRIRSPLSWATSFQLG